MKHLFRGNLLACGKVLLALLTVLSISGKLHAQAGSIDASFNASDIGLGFGDGSNGVVYASALQTDGKILIGGSMTAYNGVSKNRLVRLNANGSLDSTFNTGTGPGGTVNAIAIQADGKILIGGSFGQYNGATSLFISRLNTDGTLDTTFTSGANTAVNTIDIQPDGKILIGGDFTSYNSTTVGRIARLNSNGTLDATFNPGTGASNSVYDVTLQPDGKVLVGGIFTTFNGLAKTYLTRLNTDGSLDGTFSSGTGVNNLVNVITMAGNGKILIGGDFTTYNGTTANRLAQLNTNGTLDGTFSSGTGPNGTVTTITVQADGKVLIGGIFSSYNGATQNSFSRVNANGSLDATFNTNPNNRVQTSLVQADGKILIGGLFSSNGSTISNFFGRLNTDGTMDAAFNPGTGASGAVTAVIPQADGKILVGGSFSFFNGVNRNRIARLNANGTLDTTFNPGTGASTTVTSIALQTDGKILIGGQFTVFNGVANRYIARLNSNGSLDSTFNSGTAALSFINAVVLQPDGKILIGGLFTSYNGVARNRIARLNTDGTLDLTFDPGGGVNSTVNTIALQPDGKILLGGSFTTYNGTARNRVARLNTNGTLDTGFDPGTGANSGVNAITVQADGRILLGGGFTNYNGTLRNALIRITAGGAVDSTFVIGSTSLNGAVTAISVQPDGKMLIVGGFTTYGIFSRNRVARLNADGTLDTGFDPGTGANSAVSALARLANGKVLIGGGFTSYNGTGRNRLVSIQDGTGPLPVTLTGIRAYRQASGVLVEWQVQQEQAIQAYIVERSEDGVSFKALGEKPAAGKTVYTWTDLTATAGQTYYFRVRIAEKTGSVKYSSIVKLSAAAGDADLAVYPNPIQGNSFQLAFINQPAGMYVVRLFNAQGQMIDQVNRSHPGGSKTESITLPEGLQKGQYFLDVNRAGGERKVLRIAR